MHILIYIICASYHVFYDYVIHFIFLYTKNIFYYSITISSRYNARYAVNLYKNARCNRGFVEVSVSLFMNGGINRKARPQSTWYRPATRSVTSELFRQSGASRQRNMSHMFDTRVLTSARVSDTSMRHGRDNVWRINNAAVASLVLYLFWFIGRSHEYKEKHDDRPMVSTTR